MHLLLIVVFLLAATYLPTITELFNDASRKNY